MVTLSYSLALLEATTAWLIEAASFAASASWSAATVTVCATLQLLGVKVSVFWLPDVTAVSTVTSELLLVSVITTSEVGCTSRTTV